METHVYAGGVFRVTRNQNAGFPGLFCFRVVSRPKWSRYNLEIRTNILKLCVAKRFMLSTILAGGTALTTVHRGERFRGTAGLNQPSAVGICRLIGAGDNLLLLTYRLYFNCMCLISNTKIYPK